VIGRVPWHAACSKHPVGRLTVAALTPLAGMGTMLIAAVVLLGWAVDSQVLIGVLPGLVPMNPATACGFLLGGAALWLARGERPHPAARVLAAAVLLLAGLRLGGYLLGTEVGVDQVLFRTKLATVPYGPNRMAPNTALCFLLVGAALWLLDRETARGRRPAEHLALVAAVVSLLTLTGYAYSQEALGRVGTYIPMALNTALGFALLSAGILLVRPARGLMAVVTSRRAAGTTARRLLLVAIGVPWGLGWLSLWGRQRGLYDIGFGGALVAVATMILLAAVVWRHASFLDDAERDRERRTAELEAANAALESFSYSVSHDLRAPLRAMDGFARILTTDYAPRLDGEANRLLGVICDNARHMGRLIDDLLEFSRMGRKELGRRRVDMAERVGSVLSELRQVDPERAVSVRVGALPPAHVDPSMIRQVLANLVGNAWKFTQYRAEPSIEIDARAGAGETVYFVRDNGAGFDMEFADKLFGVFQRLHPESFEGTGVGLAIVQRIIQRHGGRVWAEGKVDAGATFYFALPAEREE